MNKILLLVLFEIKLYHHNELEKINYLSKIHVKINKRSK